MNIQLEDNEEIKQIKDYEDYFISSHGRVWSNKSNKWLSPGISRGYLSVHLSNKNGKKFFRIHRLVALYFIPNPNNYEIVNHKDENKLNNNVDNLEWCDAKYNNNYGTSIQRRIQTLKNHKQKKYTQVWKCNKDTHEYIELFDTIEQAAKSIGPGSLVNIRNCLKGRINEAYDFWWTYKKD